MILLALFACSDGKPPDDTSPPVTDTDPGPADDTSVVEDPDADGDGWPASEDCDDTEENAWPGAPEVWYDGEDWDCADDDDYDADADGHRHEDYEGEDCDDQDPSVHPDAEDPACDGLDQDCDGSDSADEDGDGELAEACGGNDCDDADAWIGPHMSESCDQVDRDCDGRALEDGVCGEPQEALALASLTVIGDVDGAEGAFEGGTVTAGDLDADGLDEIYTFCAYCETSAGSMGWQSYLFEGPLEGRDILHTDVAYISIEDAGWEQDEQQMPPGGVGDFDGDGFEDLLTMSGQDKSSDGMAYLVLGPADDWGSHVDLEDDATFAWRSRETEFTAVSGAPGDLDGDGRDDFVLWSSVSGSGSADDGLWVFLGRDAPHAQVEYFDEEEIVVELPGSVSFYDSTDLDGDGFTDVFVRGEDLWIASGPDLAAGHGASIADLSWQIWTDAPDCLALLGDWTGDGYPDWLGGDDDEDSWVDEGGVLHFVAGSSDMGEMALTETAVGHAYGYADQHLGGKCLSANLDGAGEPEAVVLGYSTESDDTFSHHVIRSDLGLPEGTASFEADLEYVLSSDRALYGRELSAGDWNADGYDDLVFPDYNGSLVDGPGGFAIVPGWDIPWDEPQYW